METAMNIDEEWNKFNNGTDKDDDDDDDENNIFDNLDDEYSKFLKIENEDEILSSNIKQELISSEAPKASNIYISTKTKISYLNKLIDLKKIFWLIDVIPYAKPSNGVVKKQMKFSLENQEELTFIQNKLKDETYVEEYIITHIDNPTGRIKFKDVRKISIGICKKDIMSYRCKKKSAFYNCFVLILRMNVQGVFKEFHVKVFNTGKLEIPGVQSEENFEMILQLVIDTLQPFTEGKLGYKDNSNETVLINSNFNCGFFINRETLYETLKFKYNIQAIYDPCSYPGIQCKFYYNPDIGLQNGCQISEENKHLYTNVKEVSFMIFRTGSVLIVGKCDENVLFIIYEFLKVILINEYKNICQQKTLITSQNAKDKKKKLRKKTIIIEMENPLKV
jgi:TATA-box binding protein (TBP) (component of TFIID and TFIIIB)